MKKTQFIDTIRNIRANFISWLAIVIVVMITCGVYCGVFYYADAMESKADEFYKKNNLNDLTIISAMGLSDEDIDHISEIPGVTGAEGTLRITGADIRHSNKKYSTELMAVTKYICLPALTQGRLPDSEDECVLTKADMERLDVKIGDEIEVNLTGGIALSYTITGSVLHPEAYYHGETVHVFTSVSSLSRLLGTENYPEVLVTVSAKGALLSDEYLDSVAPIKQKISKELSNITGFDEKTGYVITGRMDSESFMVLRQIVDMLRKLSTIFVIIFIIIGAIVVISTIAVVIDGQKKQIGFLKACGFFNREIIIRYLVFGESAVITGMIFTICVAFLLQLILRSVLGGMFSMETLRFTMQPISYGILFLSEALLAAILTTIVTVINASSYSAIDLLHWNGKIPKNTSNISVKNVTTSKKSGRLYSKLIVRNMLSDSARVTASVIIIAGCCLMIGVGMTLNEAFHSMTIKTRDEIARYDLECTLADDTAFDELEAELKESNASFKKITKVSTVYDYNGHEEYVTVIAAEEDIFGDYICLISPDGEQLTAPDNTETSLTAVVQNRIFERLGAQKGDEILIFDNTLTPHSVKAGSPTINYIGRVMYLSEASFRSIFGSEPANNTFLIRLNGKDRESFAEELSSNFPDADISFTDAMPTLFLSLTDAFNALIYVMITLSVIMSVFVLLNLVNIFVSRRQNELIIMAINGFNFKEEIGYLLRETIATTVLGLTCGVLLGAVLTKTLVQVIEAPDTMCARAFNPKAWIIAIVMEGTFALLINLRAFQRVKRLSIKDL